MAVVTNFHRITGQTGQALDVKQILVDAVDGLGFKNDDFTAIGFSEIVGEPVHQKMIPRFAAHLDDVFTRLVNIVIVRI